MIRIPNLFRVSSGDGIGNAAVEAEARTVMAGARLLPRHHDPEDGARVVVHFSPRNNFIFSGEEAERRIRRMWPELNDAQVHRLVRYLGARVRAVAEPERLADRPSWVHDWAALPPPKGW